MMDQMMRHQLVAGVALALLAAPAAPASGPELVSDVLRKLNEHPTVATSEDAKSYKTLFDAYLKLTEPPFEVGPGFNLETIHPQMDGWPQVSGWAESNRHMADAIIESRDRTVIGLPYGRSEVPSKYREADLVVDVAVNGNLHHNEFPYLHAVDVMAAFAAAEIYRRMEAGQVQEGLDLAMANIFVLRQFCDRDFLVEKTHHISLLSMSLANLRDVFYGYLDAISANQFKDIAWWELPFLRPDRNRLLMPEADRIVAAALIKDVFNPVTGRPDEAKFARTFASIQSAGKPLTRFGAARRWMMISKVHGSLDASLERLTLVYDDWWRRWRVQEYDAILSLDSQFERTNPVRYAAVIHSLQDIEDLFSIRNKLIAEVNGTAVAAGLCGYRKEFGTFPAEVVMTRQFARKLSDTDPYDLEFGEFKYRLTTERESIDTAQGRLWVEPGQALLYSQGQDHMDGRAERHSDDGLTGDLVIWPPIKAMQRRQGLIE